MISYIYSAIFAVFLVLLSINVISGRRKFKVAIGSNSINKLDLKIRAQANFTEYTPIFLLLLFFAESINTNKIFIHIAAIFFLFGRMLHAFSLCCMEKHEENGMAHNISLRVLGMVITFTCILSLSITLLINYFIPN